MSVSTSGQLIVTFGTGPMVESGKRLLRVPAEAGGAGDAWSEA